MCANLPSSDRSVSVEKMSNSAHPHLERWAGHCSYNTKKILQRAGLFDNPGEIPTKV